MFDSGAALLLAMPHLRCWQVAQPDCTLPVLNGHVMICALVADFQMPDCARIFGRPSAGHIQIPTFPAASSAVRRAIATMWAPRLQAAKKDALLASSRIFLHGHRAPSRAYWPSRPEPKSIILLLPKLTRPSHVTWPLARLPICLRCHI